MSSESERPFAELPAALVEEMITRTESVSGELLAAFQDLRNQIDELHNRLVSYDLLAHESDLEYVPIPTTCGVDGSFAIERLLATDLVAVAAVAVEGLTPPSETRYWPEPQHQVFVESEEHDEDSGLIARALMLGMELSLATMAPHEVVFIDGSLTTPLIYFNQALTTIAGLSHLRISGYLLNAIKQFLQAYETILRSQRTDRAWLAVPKYTIRREIGEKAGWSAQHDDRAMLTSVLRPGEFTRPIVLSNRDRRGQPQVWHLNTSAIRLEDADEVKAIAEQVTQRLSEIRVLYYRPYPNLPALRLEMSRSVAETPGRLAGVLHAVKHQCGTGAIMEPYPLYMADRMAKSLGPAIPTVRQIISQRMAEDYDGDIGDIFLGLHGYRTESGR